MADVVICSAPENEASVRQLAEAVAREGYSVWHSDAPSDASSADAVTEEIGAARAAIVIWSEAASASEWVRAEANVARGLKKLVQVSADGRPPPVPFDRAEMISVLTWRGEEDHPAWRGIKAGLVALCGSPAEKTVLAEPAAAPAPPLAPVPAEPAAAPMPVPVPAAPASAAPGTPSKGPGVLLIVLIVALVLAALAAGGWYWTRGRAPAPAPAPIGNEAAAAPAPPEFPAGFTPPPNSGPAAPAEPEAEQFNRAATIQGVDHVFVRSTPSGIGFNLARVEAGEVFTTYEQPGDWWRVRTASGRVGYMNMAVIRLRGAAAPAPAGSDRAAPGQANRSERRPGPRPRGPRIRKENSEVMAAFCQGAGRGTPQCRAFSRQLRN